MPYSRAFKPNFFLNQSHRERNLKLEIDTKRKAILDQGGHLLVCGGPGSGKTTIALLKARVRCRSLLPGQNVLFLSFSRAAVRQILQRCKSVLTAQERQLIEVKTYHAFCLEHFEVAWKTY